VKHTTRITTAGHDVTVVSGSKMVTDWAEQIGRAHV
jgi:hypothetical protein